MTLAPRRWAGTGLVALVTLKACSTARARWRVRGGGDNSGPGLAHKHRSRLPARMGHDCRAALSETPARRLPGSAKTNDVELPAGVRQRSGASGSSTGPHSIRARTGAPVDLAGVRVSEPVVLKDDSGPKADELQGRQRGHCGPRQRRAAIAARVGPRGSAGARLQGASPGFPSRSTSASPDASFPTPNPSLAAGDQHVRRSSTPSRRKSVVEFTLNGRALRLRSPSPRGRSVSTSYSRTRRAATTYAAALSTRI